MPRHLHDNDDGGTSQGGTSFLSRLGRQCNALNVSIHDRELVYELNLGLRKVLNGRAN